VVRPLLHPRATLPCRGSTRGRSSGQNNLRSSGVGRSRTRRPECVGMIRAWCSTGQCPPPGKGLAPWNGPNPTLPRGWGHLVPKPACPAYAASSAGKAGIASASPSKWCYFCWLLFSCAALECSSADCDCCLAWVECSLPLAWSFLPWESAAERCDFAAAS
jgi:hypothetical protein